jgi:uncharacterized LabA/DUF88 family protein
VDGPPKPHAPHERLSVYIDGFNLYHGLHDATRRAHLWLDFVALCSSLRPRSRLVSVKYFTAPVLNDPEGLSRQAHHQAAVSALHPNVFKIIQGRYQSREVLCRGCGRQHIVREEKETDVNIAVHLVSDAARHEMDSALVISADSDLSPAIRMAQQLNPQIFIAAAFPPNRYSNELRSLMPASFKIGMDRVRKAQLPDRLNVNGTEYARPARWFSADSVAVSSKEGELAVTPPTEEPS